MPREREGFRSKSSNMAHKEHVKRVTEGVIAWNSWVRENPDVRPDLSGVILSGVNLSGANFSGADLREASLISAQLINVNLRGANLSGAHLSEVNLRAADLSGADLRKADLRGANFIGAALSRANLSLADLRGADLISADFDGANFRGAILKGVDFSRADLNDADFSNVVLEHSTFGDNDLSTITGLETVIHLGPSTVGVDTLYKSNGKIPDIFLRGVGLPEVFITFLPSLIARPIEFYSCFVSYSHADKSFARRLHDALQGRGIRCWLDHHQLFPGDKIYTEVDRGIRLWDKVLLCCSKEALTSWWVDNEIKIAFDKEQHLWRERQKEVLALIPLNLDDYLFSDKWRSGLATEVKARMAADFGGWEQDNKKFEEQFERLVKALRTDSGGKEPPPPTLL